ncbi:baeRF7 domain-containing protein [Rubinisphaera italica]|uniref:Uncharacterized protein n=1 Tax=Rubinisphaera italica TaxID=2527969 RepID=A0A5C5XBF0_9PLAN|nr:hypothetical protein [Rubinisphaera italica]TWT60134.1 hypothetical protein Pan54_08480 [Rubinisphaera italica]
MDNFTKNDLIDLAEQEGHALISLYIPTERAGREVLQNRIRFKNILGEVEGKIQDAGSAGEKFNKQLKELHTWEKDDDWWQHQSDGLAVFLDGVNIHRWRIPVSVPSICTCEEFFTLRPLCELLQDDGQYYLLGVSQNQVRLFQGTKTSIVELHPEALPENLRSALNIDEYVSSLQQHSTSANGTAAMFHGHGGSDLDVKKQDEILQYFRHINRALSSYLGNERRPLVFAGVDYLFPIFKEACEYNTLLEDAVIGNPDHLDADQLHSKSWPIVEPFFATKRNSALERFQAAGPEGQGIDDLDSIVQAADQGQVETLLVKDSHANRVPNRGEQKMMNLAIVKTLRAGGSVFTVPAEKLTRPAAAILRYSIMEGSSK